MQIEVTKDLNEIEHNKTVHNEIEHNKTVHNEIEHNEIVHNEIEHNKTGHNETIDNEEVHNEMETTNKVLLEILDEQKCNKIKEQLKSISIGYKEWDSTQWLTGC